LSIAYEALLAMGEGLNDPSIFKAVFLAGGPGSGKSFVTKNTTGGLGLRVLNSDTKFEFLMKKAGKSLKMHDLSPEDEKNKDLLRLKGKQLTKAKEANLLVGRLGLVIDGTGKDFKKIRKYKEDLEAFGYDTSMIFVNVEVETSLRRNKGRERSLTDDDVKKFHELVRRNIGRFQGLFGDANFHIIDADQDLSPKSKVFTKIWKKVKAFTAKPIHNPIATKWIKDEKTLRGIK
jgi:cytidylate kinase